MNNQTVSNNDSEAGSQPGPGPLSSTSLPLAINRNHDEPRTPTISDVIEPVGEGVPADSEPFIFKIHNLLRNVNSKAYDPAIISIGPYHWDKPHLQLMKAHKLRFQKLMLERKNEELSRYLDAIRPEEEKARKSYAESTSDIQPDEFVEMLVLDGIFIVELLWKFKRLVSDRQNCDVEIRNDPLFRMPWALNQLQRDLMLFENQIPFFIPVKLFRMIQPECELKELSSLALFFFNDLFPGQGKKRESSNIKHLLDLIHMFWGSKKVSPSGHANTGSSCNMDNLEPMRCATKLKEVGIKLVMVENQVSFDIEFENGELRIPVLTIEDTTESLLRNLIAYEQYCGFHIVTDYMAFFSCLIKTRVDVARLTKHGILKSFISDENATTRMFSTMSDWITGPSENFHYADLFKRVNDYCKTPWNRYMAILRRDYANSPWGIISIIAAFLLLSLAVLEVTFQILSWNQQRLAS